MMKNKAVFTILVTIGLIIFCNESVYSAGEYHVVQEHSAVAFEGKNLKGEVIRGEFTEFSGEVFLDKHNLETFEANIKVRATSVESSDIERNDQLRGEVFFDVINFPTISFISKKLLRKKTDVTGKQPNYEIMGILNIKGQPAEIVVPISISGPIAKPMGGELIYVAGEKTISLKDFGDAFNHLFNNKMVYDDSVKLIIRIEAEKENKSPDQY